MKIKRYDRQFKLMTIRLLTEAKQNIDITYIHTKQGFLYVAIFLDIF